MRQFALSAGLALAVATTFALAPAMAEMGGPMKVNGMCRVYGANNQNGAYYHMEACPKPAAAAVTVVHHHHHRG